MGYADGGILRINGMYMNNVSLGVTVPIYIQNIATEFTISNFLFEDSTVESSNSMVRVVGA